MSKSTDLIRQQENIYYDMFYVNKTNGFVPAAHIDRRSSPIVNVPANYKLSCIRMDLSVRDVPMMYTGFLDLEIALEYAPDNLIARQKLFVNTLNPIRYIYNVQEIIDAIGGVNTTIEDCFNDIISQYEAIHGPGSWTNINRPTLPSFIDYVQATGFSLYSDINNYDTNPEAVKLHFSYDLAVLFDGFPFNANKNDQNPLLPKGLWSQPYVSIYKGDLNVVDITISGSPVPVILTRQNYDCYSSWYHFSKILLSSNSLGVRQSYYSSPAGSSNNNISYPIITDFILNLDNSGNSPSSILVYYPTAEYRMIDILSETPITTVDLSLKLADNQGNVIDLSLFPGDHFAVKLLFTNSISH